MILVNVASAIKDRYVGATATLGSTTETLKVCTHRLPNTVQKGPALLVFHPSGPLRLGTSRQRDDRPVFPVRLLRDPANVPTRSDWLYAWYDALRDRAEMNTDLDLSYVQFIEVIEMDMGIDGFLYAGKPFDFIEFLVRVTFNETVTTAAP